MEGGNRVSLNLGSDLDVSSSDMLVSIQRSTFQHNQQGYQGKYLVNSLRYEQNGWAARWNVHEFEYSDNNLDIYSTDIRRPNKRRHVGNIRANDEFQLIKQQWNSTSEVENFWWVDDEHILVLDRYNFVLKRKTNEVDDWDGDRWEDIYKIDRHTILNETCFKYTCCNTFNTERSSLFLVCVPMSDMRIECSIYYIRNSLALLSRFYIDIRKRNIGQVLNDATFNDNVAYFNTYSDISARQIINHAEFSDTITDDRIILGCHFDKNFNQWCIVYNLDTLQIEKCIHGYGFVGVNGDLTGGEIPDEFFDVNRGFNSTVNDFSILPKPRNYLDADDAYKINDASVINTVNYGVVGDADRQWYIKKQIYGIVSHIKYSSNGNFSKEILPITNKYDAIYSSPSFKFEGFGDTLPQAYLLGRMFDGGEAQAIINIALGLLTGTPFLFYFNPRYSSLVYLQQTIGQYSYVHYNSSENMKKPEPENRADFNMSNTKKKSTPSPVLSDDYTFDKQIVEQIGKIQSKFDSFMGILFLSFMLEIPQLASDLSVNAVTRQTSTADIGKTFLQNSLENLQEFSVSNVLTMSRDVGLNSKVVAIKSLDMFYSTSEKQEIYAGPGFVEHRFSANCVSQSSTSCQIEGSTDQLSCFLKELTFLEQKLFFTAERFLINYLKEQVNVWKDNQELGTSAGTAVAIVLLETAHIIEEVFYKQEEAVNILNKFLDVLDRKGVTCSRVASVSKHSLDNEGKHRYGEKNEVFMYPCFGIPDNSLEYHDETVNAAIKQSNWELNLTNTKIGFGQSIIVNPITNRIRFSSLFNSAGVYDNVNGTVPYHTVSCYGTVTNRRLPRDMSMIIGCDTILPNQPFKNENIGVEFPTFSSSMQHDYIIDKRWNISQCCTYGATGWVACKDTKLLNGKISNMRITDTFCGIACPYTAIEVKKGLSRKYMRPWAITPNVLAFNSTGYNSILDEKMYHSFDGLSFRVVEWIGGPGLNKNTSAYLYSFQVNDRFKRSNIFQPNELFGNFNSDPVQAVNTIDRLHTIVTMTSREKGMEGGTIGEDKDGTRWSIPIFTEPVTTLPAAVKTLTSMPLRVFEGVTSLTTTLASFNSAYKAPVSIDFSIGKNQFRQTEDFICSVVTDQYGADTITDIVPSLGLKYLGSTLTAAFFYSKATRCYYMFNGSALNKIDMLERFRDIKNGFWDPINQEVVVPCLMTFKRLNKEVIDTDTETDNIIVPVLNGISFSGELPPPITTIFNDRSWYRSVSLPSGFAYQGPNRVIINRSVFVEYMTDSMISNFGKWKKVDKEKYYIKRKYPEDYSNVLTNVSGVKGWTHNPFLLVTSALGVDEGVDCLFEWEITLCWTTEMELLYNEDDYAVVCLYAETMSSGDKVSSRPTHVYLTKELFTRNNNYGYYSFRFQSKNGAGNRERLHIWSDQYIAISSLTIESKVITSKRSEQLTQQLDVSRLNEL